MIYQFQKALRDFMRSPASGFISFIGKYNDGSVDQYGPFQSIAPEGLKASDPYMTMKFFSGPMDIGYFPSDGGLDTVTEKIAVRFQLIDPKPDRLLLNADIFMAKMDRTRLVVPSAYVSIAERTQTFQLDALPFQEQGRRDNRIVYDYTFKVAWER